MLPFRLSGSDLRAHTGSLTRPICDQIFTKALHWPKATDLPEDTTHAVNFGAASAHLLRATLMVVVFELLLLEREARETPSSTRRVA
jgi:hypothetical protein